jgi:rhomboid protease GluP
MFVHFGLLHLILNLWCLLWFGPLVERLFGTLGFAALYLLSGLGGAIASLWYHPMVLSAGASGAIFGIFGGLIGYLVIRRDVSPRSVLQLFRPGVIAYLAVDSLLGLAVPGIDGAAHLGGLATGCLCGLVLHRPWPSPPTNSGLSRRFVAACFVACGLASVFMTAAGGIRARVERDPEIASFLHARQKALGDYGAFTKAIEPAAHEFNDIADGFNEVLRRMNRPNSLEELIARDLDRLISRADANENRLRAVAVADPDLRNARDHLASAQRHDIRALRSLRSFLKDEDQRLLGGPDGYEAHIEAASEDVRSYQKQLGAYLKAHELTLQSP